MGPESNVLIRSCPSQKLGEIAMSDERAGTSVVIRKQIRVGYFPILLEFFLKFDRVSNVIISESFLPVSVLWI